jgi:hypothetical protein
MVRASNFGGSSGDGNGNGNGNTPFDKEKDKELYTQTISQNGNSLLIVSIMAYNEGQPKFQLTRKNVRPDGFEMLQKLGRLTDEEMAALAAFYTDKGQRKMAKYTRRWQAAKEAAQSDE